MTQPAHATSWQSALHDTIVKKKLKRSRQRELIASIFFSHSGHFTIEELLTKVKAQDNSIGQATLYRTMKLFVDEGMAHARHFGEGHTQYESALMHKDGDHLHHDHLICNRCHRIWEFMDSKIEQRQQWIAQQQEFILQDHKMELYGVCKECQKSNR